MYWFQCKLTAFQTFFPFHGHSKQTWVWFHMFQRPTPYALAIKVKARAELARQTGIL